MSRKSRERTDKEVRTGKSGDKKRKKGGWRSYRTEHSKTKKFHADPTGGRMSVDQISEGLEKAQDQEEDYSSCNPDAAEKGMYVPPNWEH